MKRFLIGSAITLASVLAAPISIAQTLLTIVARLAFVLNEQTILMLSLLMLVTMQRAPMMISVAWTGIRTRLVNMHFFVAGIAAIAFSIIALSFLPGTFFISTITTLFSSGTLSGFQMVQAVVFLVGLMFAIFDFPYGSVKSMRGRMQ